jgi:FkbM family methyltransferase
MPFPEHAARGLRPAHRAGAWVFDHSGPAASALARLGEPLARWALPRHLLTDPNVPVVVDGLRLYHEGRPSYHLKILAMGMHDREVAALIQRVGQPGMTVLDIGAHLGYFTLLCARLGGAGSRVWAFEPSPALNPILRRNIIENGAAAEVRIVPAAVGDRVGTATLFAGAGDSMLSSLHPAAASGSKPARADPVPCTTLDACAGSEGWPRIDLVKIDVEGHEVAVLTGMRALTRRNPGIAVIVELNERTLAATGHTPGSFWQTLAACGLDCVYLAGPRLRRVTFPQDWRLIRREIRRQGNGRVNLLCRRETQA